MIKSQDHKNRTEKYFNVLQKRKFRNFSQGIRNFQQKKCGWATLSFNLYLSLRSHLKPWTPKFWWTGYYGRPYFKCTSIFLKISSNRPTSMFYNYPLGTPLFIWNWWLNACNPFVNNYKTVYQPPQKETNLNPSVPCDSKLSRAIYFTETNNSSLHR